MHKHMHEHMCAHPKAGMLLWVCCALSVYCVCVCVCVIEYVL